MPDKGPVTVNLVRNKVLTNDFIFRTSSDLGIISKYEPGKYYNGVISNDPNSVVSISIFENEVMGFISNSNGNYVIGKLKDTKGNKHIIYNDADLVNPIDFDCYTENDGYVYSMEELTFDGGGNKTVGDCIRVYIEIDDGIVTDKGGAVGATNYVTGLFNEVITLYENDGINMVINEILAWDTPAPYSGSSSDQMLASYQANTGAFNGDLSHLVSYQASGGKAAGFAGICAPDVDNSKCFSSIYATFSTVPTYSWSVNVCTHEMGHLIGSRHTHACVWNGNGTAIDGCGPTYNTQYTEGDCPTGPIPIHGTIMSYCHLIPVGINFNLGFGPQPLAVLLNTIANSACTSPCSDHDHDYHITNITASLPNPVQGETVLVTATLINVGTNTESQGQPVKFYVDGAYNNSTQMTPQLAPGQTAEVYFNWIAVGGAHNLKVQSYLTGDQNSNNDFMEIPISVGVAGNLLIDGITNPIKSITLSPNTYGDFTLQLQNNGSAPINGTVTKVGNQSNWVTLTSGTTFSLGVMQTSPYYYKVTIPPGTATGNYSANITFNYSGGSNVVTLNIIVVQYTQGLYEQILLSGNTIINGTNQSTTGLMHMFNNVNLFNLDNDPNTTYPTSLDNSKTLTVDEYNRVNSSKWTIYLATELLSSGNSHLDLRIPETSYTYEISNSTSSVDINILQKLNKGLNTFRLAIDLFTQNAANVKWQINNSQQFLSFSQSAWASSNTIPSGTYNEMQAGLDYCPLYFDVNSIVNTGDILLFNNGKQVDYETVSSTGTNKYFTLTSSEFFTDNYFNIKGDPDDDTKVTISNIRLVIHYFAGDPNLECTKTLNLNTANINQQVTANLSFHNIGSNISNNTHYNDSPLPTGLSLVSGSLSGSTADVDPGETVTKSYIIKGDNVGNYTFGATTVTYENPGGSAFSSTFNSVNLTVNGGDLIVNGQIDNPLIGTGYSINITASIVGSILINNIPDAQVLCTVIKPNNTQTPFYLIYDQNLQLYKGIFNQTNLYGNYQINISATRQFYNNGNLNPPLNFEVKSYSISGFVKDASNNPVQNVALAFTGSGGGSAVTDAAGFYNINVPYGYIGTATPSKTDWTFSPLNTSYSNVTTNYTNQDYTGTNNTPFTADFSADLTTIYEGQSITFIDLSTGSPTTWQWTFESGDPSFWNGETPPPIQYNTPGTWDVTLEVGNGVSTDIETKLDYITVNTPPSPHLTLTPESYDFGCTHEGETVFTLTNDGGSVCTGTISLDYSYYAFEAYINGVEITGLYPFSLQPTEIIYINVVWSPYYPENYSTHLHINCDQCNSITAFIQGENFMNTSVGSFSVPTEGGTTYPGSKQYSTCDTACFSAYPNPGYNFVKWNRIGYPGWEGLNQHFCIGLSAFVGYQYGAIFSPKVNMQLKVFLEGPFKISGMNCNLVNSPDFLTNQPFNIPPWNYGGSEMIYSIPNTNIVDWILVELRQSTGDASTATSDKTIAKKAGFVLADGSIVDEGGINNLKFAVEITENLYAIVWHRNHLGIMSANPIIETDGIYNYDFTSDYLQIYEGATGSNEIVAGVWGMISGDGNADGQVNAPDKTIKWDTLSGKSGYFEGDYNLDAQVNNLDKNDLWYKNSGKSSQVLGGVGFACGDYLFDARDGQSYKTFKIGSQCWMAENINIGYRIDSITEPSNNNIIEKYCYSDIELNCDTFGGLYKWSEVMQYTTIEGVQGICPQGWHIPTDTEWCELTQFIDPTVNCSTLGYSGTDIGYKMKSLEGWNIGGNGSNSSKFNALPAGLLTSYYIELGNITYYHSSTEVVNDVSWYHMLKYDASNIFRHKGSPNFAYSVRCMKGEGSPIIFNESYNLDDNQVPEGWTFMPNIGLVDITSGRLTAHTIDARGALAKNISLPTNVNTMKFEYDGNLSYTLWGMCNQLQVDFGIDEYLLVYAQTSDYLSKTYIYVWHYQGTNQNLLFQKELNYVFDNFHYTINIDNNTIHFKGDYLSSGINYFDESINIPENINFNLNSIIGVKYWVYTTTDNDNWLDNLSMTALK